VTRVFDDVDGIDGVDGLDVDGRSDTVTTSSLQTEFGRWPSRPVPPPILPQILPRIRHPSDLAST
jgi:hypothetical protein